VTEQCHQLAVADRLVPGRGRRGMRIELAEMAEMARLN
jgi:hypothetical protein